MAFDPPKQDLDGIRIRRAPTDDEIKAHLLSRVDTHPEHVRSAMTKAIENGWWIVDERGQATIYLDGPPTQ